MQPDPKAQIALTSTPEGARVTLRGAVTINSVPELQAALGALGNPTRLELDLGGVTRLDTAGAWLITQITTRAQTAGAEVFEKDVPLAAASLLARVREAMPEPVSEPGQTRTLRGAVAGIGGGVVGGMAFLAALVGYLGLFLSRIAQSIMHPRRFRLTALVHHSQEVGLKAVPIVALMAFLIGIVLAFQGATQLRQFGAEVFVVDLIAVSILRELGILLTSIIVAGRTASAFTAAIGSMKMREEVDAMRTLGLDPAMILFVPRILALLLMLPILGIIANAAGLFGGALMAWVELGISPELFRARLLEGNVINHLTVGLVKAPVFALIIGIVGCHAGMQVKSNAESLGRQTSKAVVTAIFAVIVADAAFSIFFAQIGM